MFKVHHTCMDQGWCVGDGHSGKSTNKLWCGSYSSYVLIFLSVIFRPWTCSCIRFSIFLGRKYHFDSLNCPHIAIICTDIDTSCKKHVDDKTKMTHGRCLKELFSFKYLMIYPSHQRNLITHNIYTWLITLYTNSYTCDFLWCSVFLPVAGCIAQFVLYSRWTSLHSPLEA